MHKDKIREKYKNISWVSSNPIYNNSDTRISRS